MLNRVGASTQPCFTPFVTGKGVDYSPLSRTWACMPSWDWRTSMMNLSGHPNLFMMERPFWLMVSNAFVRSTMVVYRSAFCSWHFSCSWRAAKTMPMVPCSLRKPHWLSGSRPFPRCSIKQFRRIFAKIFPAMQRRDIPLWLSQACLLPFPLYKWTTEAYLKSWGTTPWVHMTWNNCVNFPGSWGPVCLYISAGMASAPGALPLNSSWMAFSISGKTGGVPMLWLMWTWGSCLMASSSMWEALLRTELKCSAHLFTRCTISQWWVLFCQCWAREMRLWAGGHTVSDWLVKLLRLFVST